MLVDIFVDAENILCVDNAIKIDIGLASSFKRGVLDILIDG